jgi:cell division septum initiation protein DivIVA
MNPVADFFDYMSQKMSDLVKRNEKLRRENDELRTIIKEIEDARAVEAEIAKLTAENIALQKKLKSLTESVAPVMPVPPVALVRNATEKNEPPKKRSARFTCTTCGAAMDQKSTRQVWNSSTARHDTVESSECRECQRGGVFMC